MKSSGNLQTPPIKGFNAPSNFPFLQPIKQTGKCLITQRECECLSWAALGKTASEIAEILSVSEHTIHFHTKNAINKLDAANKTHAVVIALQARYITVYKDSV